MVLARGSLWASKTRGAVNTFPISENSPKDIQQMTNFVLKKILAMPRNLEDISSLTRDQTCVLGSENTESYPLDHQGIPNIYFF